MAFIGQATTVNWCPLCQVEGRCHTYDCPNFNLAVAPSPSRKQYQLSAHNPPTHPTELTQFLTTPTTQETRTGVLHPVQCTTPTTQETRTGYCILYNGACPYGTSCLYKYKCKAPTNSAFLYSNIQRKAVHHPVGSVRTLHG